MSNDLIKVRKIETLAGFCLRLTFSDGSVGEHDFAEDLKQGGEMVVPLRNPEYFSKVFLEFGAPTWPNGYDRSPHALFNDMLEAGTLRHTVEVR